LGGALADQPALELCETGEDMASVSLDGERRPRRVEGDEMPPLATPLLHGPEEIEERQREAEQLGDHERVGVGPSGGTERTTDVSTSAENDTLKQLWGSVVLSCQTLNSLGYPRYLRLADQQRPPAPRGGELASW